MTTQHADDSATVPGRAPLILTLELAQPAQGLFQTLRERHFPPERNLIPAHISLFHALPGIARERIGKRLRAVEAPCPAVWVEAPYPLGRGVSFRLRSPELLALRAELARDWRDWLTPQDQQGYRPHVTVQNKVSPEVARETLERLQRGFVPFRTHGTSLRLWRYLGGPWEALETLALAVEPP